MAEDSNQVLPLTKLSVSAELPLYKSGEYALHAARWGHAACIKDGVIYIVGGLDEHGAPVETIETFDLRTHESRVVAKLNEPRYFCGAGLLGDELYVLGGRGYRYSNSRMVSTRGSMSSDAFKFMKRVEIRAESGEGLSGAPLASVEVFNVRTGHMSEGPRLPAARFSFGCVSIGESLYVVAGMLWHGVEVVPTNSMIRLDAKSASWVPRAPLPYVRTGDCVFVPGHFLVAIGGYTGQHARKEVCVYDLLDDAWSRLPDMDQDLSAHASVWSGSRIFCFGSYRSPEEILVYDLKSRSKETFTLRYTAARHAVALEHEGKLYVVGGKASSDGEPLALVQEFTLLDRQPPEAAAGAAR